MPNVVIFGISDSSQLAKFYIENDPKYSGFRVVAFTADSDYIDKDTFDGLPVIDFSKIEVEFPPEKNLLFVPITGINMNQVRMNKYERGKELGYEFKKRSAGYSKMNFSVVLELMGLLISHFSFGLISMRFFFVWVCWIYGNFCSINNDIFLFKNYISFFCIFSIIWHYNHYD